MPDVETQIREVLGKFWDERAIPAGPTGATTVEALVAPVESMTAVDVLIGLDQVTGLKLPQSLIRRGGYNTREQFVEDLTKKVLKRIGGAS
ncbi:MAG TPA: hypothetical protein VK195_18460 [Burkholderiaceae bacterium]|nr:hypothetical protein [Burkholderiaceae bacterium]